MRQDRAHNIVPRHAGKPDMLRPMTNTLRLTCIMSLVGVLACDSKAGTEAGSEAADETAGETGMGGDGVGDGDGDGDGDGNESLFGDCGDEVVSVLDGLDQIPAGFDSSAADIIASVAGNFAGTFTWTDVESGWTVSYAGTASPLTAALTHAGGEVRLFEVELDGLPPDGELGGLCGNYLQVDMQLDFATEDGAFAETLTVPVWIPEPDSESMPAYYYEIDFATHMGSLTLADFTVDQGMVTGIVLSGQVDDVGMGGELGMEVIISDGPDGIAGYGFMADYDAPRLP
jgi:hypothetical protein